eukprot:405108_1
MATFQSRNKLLMLSKKDLIKQCKKRNLNTFGCLAKMDFVKLLLSSNNKNANKNGGINMKMKIKKKKKKKTLSLSEPIPLPSPVDPTEMTYIAYDDDTPKPDDDNDDNNKHNVQFSDLPWKMDELKITTEEDDSAMIGGADV